jgi:hypothetical protein
MEAKGRILTVCLCGPGDVSKEIAIAKEIVTNWNLNHADAFGWHIKHKHWMTDATPDMSLRGQEVINKQLIDTADIIVAIFWSRMGTSTGIATSGTEEEIRRGIALGKRVMVYFSDLAPLPQPADPTQISRLSNFRTLLLSQGLCWSFSSRQQFKVEFQWHLSRAIHDLISVAPTQKTAASSQSIVGNNNIQAAGDVNVFKSPPRPRIIATRREGSVGRSQERQIQKWIEKLAEGTVGKARSDAYGEWWSRFKNAFKVSKYEDIRSDEMLAVKAWFTQQLGIQTRGLKSKAPDAWRIARITAIKTFMTRNGYTNETFYPILTARLRMKKPITSLKLLTKRDLDRVYNLVQREL